MKFILKNLPNSSRLGCLCGESSSFETPTIMLITRCGAVPHLTREVLKRVTDSPFLLQVPLSSCVESQDLLQPESPVRYADFCGMGEYPVYLSVQDPCVKTNEGHTNKIGVSVWGRHGRMLVHPKRLITIVENLKPDWYQVLCDSETVENSPNKRVFNSVQRSLKFTDSCLQLKNPGDRNCTPSPWITLVGGYDLSSREKFAKAAATLPASGFVVEGLHANGDIPKNINKEAIETVLKTVFPILPEKTPRLVPGAWSPDFVLNLIKAGVDLVDSSFIYLVTERGAALNFLFGSGITIDEYKHPVEDSDDPSSPFEISLWDSKYYDDMNPLVGDCTCYACRGFTRSYLHHLLKTKEMLAPILLMM